MCVCVRGRRATDVWKEKTHNIGGGGGVCVRVSGRDATDRCVEREDTRKVKFANMGLGLDDITMFVRFFLSCLNVEEYLFEITKKRHTI